MPLPAWMHNYPGAPTPEQDDNEPTTITPCTCRGEGCTTCNNTGVIYP